MKKLLMLCVSLCLMAGIQAADIYKTSRKIVLRAPSVPLITSDTYLSIWSPYDKLTEGNTEHWTAKDHPLIGAIRVDGKTYRFMGKDKPNLPAIIPMSHSENWDASYTMDQPANDWTSIDFNDANWKKGKAAFGSKGMQRVKTLWETKDIWIRRTFDLNEDLSKETIILQYSHDDIFELYLNGVKLVETDYSWNNDVMFELNANAKKNLKKGKNVIAAHCHNQTGDAYVDFGLFRKAKDSYGFEQEAIQKSVDVLPTQTYYTFTCGKVELDLVFTAPLLLDDLDLVSTPINYISYRVRALDNKKHDVQIYIETTPELAVNDISQAVTSERIEKNGMVYLKTGTIDQPVTVRKGDGVRIDWGYAYLASDKANGKSLSLGDYYSMKDEFANRGQLKPSLDPKDLSIDMSKSMTVLAYTENLGAVDKTGKAGYVMVGYDDIYSIEYFYKRRQAYWKHDGKIDIYQAFERAKENYDSIMQKTRAFDNQLMTDAQRDGGVEYAELCALAYRQAIVAHRLIKDDEGNLLFLSKENHSNGCINTVDITYPSAPLFLLYNPELLKGMLTPIFYYSESNRWRKPYPAHDLGTYPVANGQLYGEDMPVEEAGNMILLVTALAKVEGSASYAQKHWDTLTIWANYLADKGLDPDNQLCTDDFAGHLAHNANLSIKAIMAIAGYGDLARMLGKTDIADKYTAMAKSMAIEWEKMANDGDHYKLAFDKPRTWSQKYNLVWDKVFKMNIFPPTVIAKEVPFYLTKQNKYGLPLDSRKDYTKSDWIMWSACLASNDSDFKKIISPIYKYANETPTRVPLSDWHDTHTAIPPNFKARSVVGGYFMKMLENKVSK
ncbi:glutaminase domain-containing protein [Dysgonomonas sp. ZJ709]|uniref:glutaminase domain-containing protein n=1 Tax=Dysgonomonas sp. ZJ709 TaxID=2709797 RepID=UPI0013EAF76D|nr:DUF4965 domain-containing protein [Dysgonomonas sp. ZJ709]